MSYMFCNCKLLKSLPDISKWNISNVFNMEGMFYYCISLKSFKYISKWKLNKNINLKDTFKGIDQKLIPKNFKNILHI